jgi:serine phosphatase RsbU (regulator of sigma subunit)
MQIKNKHTIQTVKQPSHNIESVDLLNKQIVDLKDKNLQQALEYAEEAQYIATKIGYDKGLAYAKMHKASCLFNQSDTKHVLGNLLEAISYFKLHPNEKGYAQTLNYTGNLYEKLGEYDLSLGYNKQALKIAKQNNDLEVRAKALASIGKIFKITADYKKAIAAFKESLSLRIELGDERAIASSYNWIAETYTQSTDYASALEYYNKSIELRKKNNSKELPLSYLGRAGLYKKMGQYSKAIENYQNSLSLYKEATGDKCDLFCYKGMGEVYVELHNHEKSTSYLLNAMRLAESMGKKNILYEIHKLLAENYERSKQYKTALEHYRVYQQLQEEVLNSEMLNKLKHQQINFAVEKAQKEAEISHLRNVELKKALEQIERKSLEISDSIEYAQSIQMALLPRTDVLQKLLPQSFVLMKPRDIVSGDFYWVKQMEEKVIVAVADCTGHGVPGALLSMLGITFLNEICQNEATLSAGHILDELRAKVIEAFKQTDGQNATNDGMDIALCIVDLNKNQLQFSGANNPLYIIQAGELIEIKGDKMPISYYPNAKEKFTNHSVQLAGNESFYLFSDGFIDQFGGPKGFKYRPKRFKQLLLDSSSATTPKKQKNILEKELNSWMKGHEQTDDIIVLGVQL